MATMLSFVPSHLYAKESRDWRGEGHWAGTNWSLKTGVGESRGMPGTAVEVSDHGLTGRSGEPGQSKWLILGQGVWQYPERKWI